MALPTSGSISMTQINDELGEGLSLNNYRGKYGLPSTGNITMPGDFYGLGGPAPINNVDSGQVYFNGNFTRILINRATPNYFERYTGTAGGGYTQQADVSYALNDNPSTGELTLGAGSSSKFMKQTRQNAASDTAVIRLYNDNASITASNHIASVNIDPLSTLYSYATLHIYLAQTDRFLCFVNNLSARIYTRSGGGFNLTHSFPTSSRETHKAAAISDDGTHIVYATSTGMIAANQSNGWSSSSPFINNTYVNDDLRDTHLSSNGQYLVMSSTDGFLNIWYKSSSNQYSQRQAISVPSPPISSGVSGDGREVFVHYGTTVRVYRTSNFTNWSLVKTVTGVSHSAAISTNGDYLGYSSTSNTAVVTPI